MILPSVIDWKSIIVTLFYLVINIVSIRVSKTNSILLPSINIISVNLSLLLYLLTFPTYDKSLALYIFT